MREEFIGATTQSASYCSSPVVGTLITNKNPIMTLCFELFPLCRKDINIDVPDHQEICQKAHLEAEQWICQTRLVHPPSTEKTEAESLKMEAVSVDEDEEKPSDPVIAPKPMVVLNRPLGLSAPVPPYR